eukprot:Sdes_comp15483_c0_seq1m4401
MVIMSTEKQLKILLDNICDSSSPREDWNLIIQYCELTKNAIDGPKLSTALILSKIRSNSVTESTRALLVLETAAKESGKAFQDVVGKFKFLNELIKLVSRKYNTDTPDSVRRKILELIQNWTRTLPDQPKVREAFDMLKRQGQDFTIASQICAPPVNAPANFLKKEIKRMDSNEKDEKQAALASLLQSKHPADIAAANKLIKDLVLEDEHILEGKQKLLGDLTVVSNNIKLLAEMLENFDPSSGRIEDNELIQELRQSCTAMQPKLSSLASEMDDDDDIENILALNDQLNYILKKYHDLVDRLGRGHASSRPASSSLIPAQPTLIESVADENLIDLLAFSDSATSTKDSRKNHQDSNQTPSSHQSLLDFDLNALGMSGPSNPSKIPASSSSSSYPPHTLIHSPPPKYSSNQEDASHAVNDLLDIQFSLVAPSTQKSSPARDLIHQDVSNITPSSSLAPKTNHQPPNDQSQNQSQNQSAADAVDDILQHYQSTPEAFQPKNSPPLTVLDKDGLRIMFYFGQEAPAENITEIFITFLNSLPSPMEDFVFQAAVPKTLKLKLFTASDSQLPAFNLVKGAIPITQMMLIANPTNQPIKLRFKVSYQQNGKESIHQGQVTDFNL